jgi:hypothetical protein
MKTEITMRSDDAASAKRLADLAACGDGLTVPAAVLKSEARARSARKSLAEHETKARERAAIVRAADRQFDRELDEANELVRAHESVARKFRGQLADVRQAEAPALERHARALEKMPVATIREALVLIEAAAAALAKHADVLARCDVSTGPTANARQIARYAKLIERLLPRVTP